MLSLLTKSCMTLVLGCFFTCQTTPASVDQLEEDLDVNYDFLREELRTSVLFEALDGGVKADLIAALDYCEEFTVSGTGKE